MEVQEIKIDGITYIKDKYSTICFDCAFVNKDCNILIQGEDCIICALFDMHVLKVKED